MVNQSNVPDIMGEMLGRVPIKPSPGAAKVVRIPAENTDRLRRLVDRMKKMRLSGMVSALEDQLSRRQALPLEMVDQLERMVEREENERRAKRMKTRLRKAGLEGEASLAGLDYSPHRGLDRGRIDAMAACDWLEEGSNLIITGPVGSGKSYLARALSREACLKGYSVLFRRLPDLLLDLDEARNQGGYAMAVEKMVKYDLLVVDDWGLGRLESRQGLDLLEVVERRRPQKSILVVSHRPPGLQDGLLDNATLEEALMDRLISDTEWLQISGPSLRAEFSQHHGNGSV